VPILRAELTTIQYRTTPELTNYNVTYVMSDQNLKNHAKIVPLFHFGVLIGGFLTVIGAFVHLFSAWGEGDHYTLSLLAVMSIILLLAGIFGRIFALKAQDRAIRVEENLRNYVRNGALLDPKLTTRQIIGLRFAPDAEFDDLAKKAVANNMSEKEIKSAIKNWKADEYRA
jgi:hypothetical protein